VCLFPSLMTGVFRLDNPIGREGGEGRRRDGMKVERKDRRDESRRSDCSDFIDISVILENEKLCRHRLMCEFALVVVVHGLQ
jgi:hypothetical protein